MRGAQLVPLILDCEANAEVAKVLLKAKAAVNAANNDGWTPLHFAALSRRARSSSQPSAAPHARRCSARTAREAAH